MAINSRSQQSETWNEYKLLVLAELERLDDCLNKLREQHITYQQYNTKLLSRRISDLNKEINQRVKESDEGVLLITTKDIESVLNRVIAMEELIKQTDIAELRKNKINFWTATITIFGSLVVSLIGLIISIIS